MSPYTPRRQIVAKLKEKKEKTEHRKELLDLWLQKAVKLKKFFKEKCVIILDRLKNSPSVKPQIKLLNLTLILNKNRDLLKNIRRSVLKWFKKIKQIDLGPILSVFKKLFKPLNRALWKFRFYLLLTILLCLMGINVYFGNSSFKIYQRHPEQTSINLYPSLPSGYFEHAAALFLHGHENEALKYFSKGKNIYKVMEKLSLGFIFNPKYTEAENLLQAPVIRRGQIAEIEKLEKTYPFSWQLLATKVWFQKELYMEEQAKQTQTKIEWLYPKYQTDNQIFAN